MNATPGAASTRLESGIVGDSQPLEIARVCGVGPDSEATMPRAYAVDLRERLVEAVAGVHCGARPRNMSG